MAAPDALAETKRRTLIEAGWFWTMPISRRWSPNTPPNAKRMKRPKGRKLPRKMPAPLVSERVIFAA